MTQINFYVSKEAGIESRLAIVYRLVTMALQRNLSIHIHTDDEASSNLIDNILWKKDKSSFIPHTVINDIDINSDQDSSNLANNILSREVSISHNYEPQTNCDYLINFSLERPSFFSRYLKMAEIIDSSDEILSAGRKRYAFYRDRGYTLQYHQL